MEKCNQLLSDEKMYQKLKGDSTAKYKKVLVSMLKDLNDQYAIATHSQLHRYHILWMCTVLDHGDDPSSRYHILWLCMILGHGAVPFSIENHSPCEELDRLYQEGEEFKDWSK